MAQVGSYVPARSLIMTATDAVFARMGARDNLAQGQSTFMVELMETAAALNRGTPRSSVLLDELVRRKGTMNAFYLC